MTGTALRLGRLFRESGRSFVTAFDHGTTLRMPMPGPGPREVLSTIVDSGPDGVLLSAGMLATNADLFARRGAPVPVVRARNSAAATTSGNTPRRVAQCSTISSGRAAIPRSCR